MLIHYVNLVDPDGVSPLYQCIWNNRHICIDRKPCFYQHFVDCGIRLVIDLFESDGTVIPFDNWIQRGLHRRYYLQWRGILSAIPNPWKHLFKQGFTRDNCILKGLVIHADGTDFDIRNMTSKSIYSLLLKHIFKPPTSEIKYTDELNIDSNDWGQIYLMPFKSTYDVKTRIFQYKINLNCLMTNYRLHKMNLIDNAMCTFCHNSNENLKHLFWDCTCAKKIWSDFKIWYEAFDGCNIELNYKNVIFCSSSNLLTNLCLMLIKKVIYNCRFSNQRPSLILFKNMIIFHYKLEKQIALSNNSMYKFVEKWNCVEEFCTENM